MGPAARVLPSEGMGSRPAEGWAQRVPAPEGCPAQTVVAEFFRGIVLRLGCSSPPPALPYCRPSSPVLQSLLTGALGAGLGGEQGHLAVLLWLLRTCFEENTLAPPPPPRRPPPPTHSAADMSHDSAEVGSLEAFMENVCLL